MPLQTIIKEKRKELGMTQEQVADFLGVSTPAVNKWENGITYPDITLIAPLARLLKTDLNTLLCFHEELTKQEIQLFTTQVVQKIQTQGFASGLALAKEKIAEYPNNAELIHDLALILDGSMMLFPSMEEEQKNQYEDEINSLYERIDQCENEEIRNSVNYMLASKYTQKGDLAKAQQLIDKLPKPNALNKNYLQATLMITEKKYDEAEAIYERLLVTKVSDVWNLLLSLSSCELKAGHIENATKYAAICSQFAALLQFNEYYQLTPTLQLAAHKKDTNTCITILESLLPSMQNNGQFSESKLYQHVLKPDNATDGLAQIIPAMINQLEKDAEFEFLRQDNRFQELISQYK